MSRDSDLIYDVPESLAEVYRRKQVRLRTTDPDMLADSLNEEDRELIFSVQQQLFSHLKKTARRIVSSRM